MIDEPSQAYRLPPGWRVDEVIAHRVLSTIVKVTGPDGTHAAVKGAPMHADPKFAVGPELIERVLRNEIDVLRRCAHRNVVRLIDVWDGPMLALELLKGPALVDAPIATAEALRYGAEIAGALAYLHGNGIIHCDVNPSNAVLDAAGSPKLVDFGIAVVGEGPLPEVRRDPTMALFAGSPWFVSPEQVKSETLSAATDLYSLGITLYFWLTGTIPYPEESDVVAACRHHIDTAPRPLTAAAPGLPSEIADAIAPLLEKEPCKRPHDAAALESNLRELAMLPNLGAFALSREPYRRLTSGEEDARHSTNEH